MVAEGNGPQEVTRNMYVKRNRKTFVTVAGVQVQIIPVTRNGYDSFDIKGPGIKIAHETLTPEPPKS
jgi:hypothetical protein